MLNIALFQPEIPPNTGNIIRLCANTGSRLHIIHPCGFELDDKRLRRAGLDYHEWATISQYPNYTDFQKAMFGKRLFACTTKAKHCYTEPQFKKDDVLLFGPETKGLPNHILEELYDTQIRIPMLPDSRSVNLSNAVSIVLFEAWRQLGFKHT